MTGNWPKRSMQLKRRQGDAHLSSLTLLVSLSLGFRLNNKNQKGEIKL